MIIVRKVIPEGGENDASWSLKFCADKSGDK